MSNRNLVEVVSETTMEEVNVSSPMIDRKASIGKLNKVLMMNSRAGTSRTNKAIVINKSSPIRLYALFNGKGVITRLLGGEILNIIGHKEGIYCKVEVQKTGLVGYIGLDNMRIIFNGTESPFKSLLKYGKIINASIRVMLRSEPSVDSRVIRFLTNETEFNILGIQGQWYKIEVNGDIGFVYGSYVCSNLNKISSNIIKTQENEVNNNVDMEISMDQKLYVYAKPKSINIIATLSGGVKVKAISESDGWSHIEFDGQRGYIPHIVLMAAIAGNNIIEAYKSSYLNELKNIENKINLWSIPMSSRETLRQAYKASKLWEGEMKVIYNSLLYYLPERLVKDLKTSQRNWSLEVSKEVNQLKKSQENLEFIGAYKKEAIFNKERCFALINEYMI